MSGPTIRTIGVPSCGKRLSYLTRKNSEARLYGAVQPTISLLTLVWDQAASRLSRSSNGEKKWFTPLAPAAAVSSHPGQDGPLTATPGVIFSGGWDGILRALSTQDGNVLWEYNTVRDFETVNAVTAKGGSMCAAGPVISGNMMFVPSGYVGVRNGMPGNVLLAFGAP